MNQVGIVGRLTKDPSMRVLGEGRVHTTFVVAISRNFRNQRGEIESDYVLCSTWGRTAQNVAKYCMKGSQVAITGRIQSRHYDKEDGSRVYVTEVIGDQVRFLDKRKPSDELIPKRTETDTNAEFDFQPPETEQVNS
ncbi:MAG: single-stranded DNA-binding protein [Bacillota bacterium]